MFLVAVCFSVITEAQNYVTAYADCNFNGTSQMFKVGRYNLSQSRIGERNLSSLVVPVGYRVILYTSSEPGGGQKTTLTSDASCLTSTGWNDRAASMVIEDQGYNNDNNNNNNNGGTQTDNMVTLYGDCYYRGSIRSLSAGYHDAAGLGIGNDQLSSLKVPAGWSITLYEDDRYRGRSITYSTNVMCLPSNWNDRVSSVFVSSRGSNGGNNNNDNNNNNNGYNPVTLYTDCYFGGGSASFKTGRFNDVQLGIGNDKLSSFKVASGYSITLYENANYSGKSITYTGDNNCLNRDWNDKVSSIYIARNNNNGGNWNNGNNNNNNNSYDQVTIFENEDFGGRSVSLRVGSYANLSRVGFSQKALSSIQLPAGWKVVLYDQPNFRGSSYTVLRTKDKFHLSGWNDRAASMIIYSSGGL